MAIQAISRGSLRRSIGRNLGILIDGAATTTTDTSSLIDTKNLLGGDDEHNQKEVLIYETTDGAAPEGESSVVSDFDGATNDATCAPVFTAPITALDKYEMWKTPWRIADINDVINQIINGLTGRALQIKEIHTPFTQSSKYLYDELSGFTHLDKVEYVSSKGFYHLLDNCDLVWTAGSINVAVTADTAFKKVGNACVKAVEDGGSGATAILAYHAISEVDISDCDAVEFWMYSSIALTAGQLQFHLSSTAAIASAEETIDIPAMDAATWYKHTLSLANPQSDTAIISIGVYQVVDVTAFTFYVDEVEATKFSSKVFETLNDEYWDIAQGSTPYLQLSTKALSIIRSNTQLRLTGYQIPARLDADATVSEIDPAYIIPKATGILLVSHAKSAYLDIHDRAKLATYWLAEAARKEPGLATGMTGSARVIRA